MVLLSPEIPSQPFDLLQQLETFSSRLCALGIDDVHLVQDRDDPSFQDEATSCSFVMVFLHAIARHSFIPVVQTSDISRLFLTRHPKKSSVCSPFVSFL